MSHKDLNDKLYELINAATLGHDERKFIFDVNSGKIKLDFLEHHDIVKSIISKQKVFENIDNKEEMMWYIEEKIQHIDEEIDDLEESVRRLENEKDNFKEIFKTLSSLSK